jgi:phosphoenolpyruvate carboxykinase (ATP)
MLNAALDGKLDQVEYFTDPVFGFQVPKSCPDVPEGVMDPASSWHDRDAYTKRYRSLASRFIDNFKKFEADTPAEIKAAGPKI